MHHITTPISSPPPSLPLFFTMFFTIYLTSHFIIFRNWTPKTRPEAASCIISLTHGTPAAILAATAIISTPTPQHFASPNTQFQNTVLEYSIAYFLTDLIHYLTFYPNDVLFISHHVATLFVLMSCRYVVHGACGVLGLLMLAEVTSLFQNVWTLAGARRFDSEVARQVFDKMSVPFYAVYSVVRGVVGPLFVCKMVWFYASGVGGDAVPKWLWVSWVCVVVLAISVSVVWVSGNWVEWYRERMVRIEKEKKIR